MKVFPFEILSTSASSHWPPFSDPILKVDHADADGWQLVDECQPLAFERLPSLYQTFLDTKTARNCSPSFKFDIQLVSFISHLFSKVFPVEKHPLNELQFLSDEKWLYPKVPFLARWPHGVLSLTSQIQFHL